MALVFNAFIFTVMFKNHLICFSKTGIRKDCWPFNRNENACFRYDEQCKFNDQCNANEVCCDYECGTRCLNKDLIPKTEQKSNRQINL